MTPTNELRLESSTRGTWPLLMGAVIGLVSAAGLAWDGRAGVDVLSEVLLARDGMKVADAGERLARIGWCPLGMALGGTLVAFGLRRESMRRGISPTCANLVTLYGILGVCGAGSVLYSTNHVRSLVVALASSQSAINAGEISLAVTAAAVTASRGWLLLSIAEIALLAGCFAQVVSRPRTTLVQWPASAMLALILLWLFAASVSITWVRTGLALIDLVTVAEIQASVVVNQIMGVIISGLLGSGMLMLHAMIVTVLATIAAARCSASTDAV